FFFSSRRRHTRSDRDWSSDVCSSDLRTDSFPHRLGGAAPRAFRSAPVKLLGAGIMLAAAFAVLPLFTMRSDLLNLGVQVFLAVRSEERRVGKECRAWGVTASENKNVI